MRHALYALYTAAELASILALGGIVIWIGAMLS